MADLVQKTKQPDRTKLARSYLDQIVANFPTTNVAPRALAQRAAIEEREDVKVTDPVLQRVVPAALVSYRQLTEAYPHTAPAEAAFIRLAQFYDDMKRYDLQAQALTGPGLVLPEDTARRVVGGRRDLRAAAARRRQGERRLLARADDVAAVSRRAEEGVGAVGRGLPNSVNPAARSSRSATHHMAGGGSWAPRGLQTRWARPRGRAAGFDSQTGLAAPARDSAAGPGLLILSGNPE